jgi:hypothetical protein
LALEHKVLPGLVLAIALLAGMGRLAVSPTQPVPPGGLAQTADGAIKLYLQREAHFYGSWQPGAWRPQHWVMPPSWGTALVLLISGVWVPFGRIGGAHPEAVGHL